MTLYQVSLLDRAFEALLPPAQRHKPSDEELLIAAARMLN